MVVPFIPHPPTSIPVWYANCNLKQAAGLSHQKHMNLVPGVKYPPIPLPSVNCFNVNACMSWTGWSMDCVQSEKCQTGCN